MSGDNPDTVGLARGNTEEYELANERMVPVVSNELQVHMFNHPTLMFYKRTTLGMTPENTWVEAWHNGRAGKEPTFACLQVFHNSKDFAKLVSQVSDVVFSQIPSRRHFTILAKQDPTSEEVETLPEKQAEFERIIQQTPVLGLAGINRFMVYGDFKWAATVWEFRRRYPTWHNGMPENLLPQMWF